MGKRPYLLLGSEHARSLIRAFSVAYSIKALFLPCALHIYVHIHLGVLPCI